jgi:hypothetical protein
MANLVGDQFVTFQAPNLRDVDKQLNAFLAEKPRDIKHLQRGIIAGSKDIGYPKPYIDPEAVAQGAPRPVIPGQDTIYVIDVVYRDIV